MSDGVYDLFKKGSELLEKGDFMAASPGPARGDRR